MVFFTLGSRHHYFHSFKGSEESFAELRIYKKLLRTWKEMRLIIKVGEKLEESEEKEEKSQWKTKQGQFLITGIRKKISLRSSISN